MQNFCRGFACVVKSARRYFLCPTMSQETIQVATNTPVRGSTTAQLSPDAQKSKISASCSPTTENPICDPGPKDRHCDQALWTAVPASAFHIRKPIQRKPIVIAAKFGNYPAGAIKVSSNSPRNHFTGESCSRESVEMKNFTKEQSPCRPTGHCDDIGQVSSLQGMQDGQIKSLVNPASRGKVAACPVSDLNNSPVSAASQRLVDSNSGPEQKKMATPEDSFVFAMDVESILLGKMKSASPAREKASDSDESDFPFGMNVESLLLEEDQSKLCKGKKRKQPVSVHSTSGGSDPLPNASTRMSGSDEEDGEQVHKWRRRWKKRKLVNKKAKGEHDDEADPSKSKAKKPKSPPPNSFIAVRIPSAEIRGKIKLIQDAMLERQKKVKSTFVSLDKLHITLMVLRVDDEETLERAKLALHNATEKVAMELTEPLLLEFSGVGNFGKRVLFALIKEGAAKEKLGKVADVVRSTFESHALPSTDSRSFNPHLTIAKVSRSSKVRGIEPELYSELVDTEFGRETIIGLELLSMTDPPTDEGYYHCFERYSFDGVHST